MKERIEYDSLGLLKGMMNVSQRHIMIKYPHIHNMGHTLFYSEICMPRFSLGRQTGKTTAIEKYAKEATRLNKSVLVVCAHGETARRFQTIGIDHCKTRSVHALPPRGITFTIGSYDRLEIIFDECNILEIKQFLDSNLPFLTKQHTLHGLVSVGDR